MDFTSEECEWLSRVENDCDKLNKQLLAGSKGDAILYCLVLFRQTARYRRAMERVASELRGDDDGE